MKKKKMPEIKEMKLLPAPKSLIHTPSPAPKRKRNLPHINTPMPTHHFVFSQLGILLISLSFLGGMYWILNNPTMQARIAESAYLPVTIKQASFGLEIQQPDDELLTFSNSVIISGTTSPKASVLIAVAGKTDHFDAMEADNAGKFQRTISLAPGLNRVEISSFDNEENSKTVVRTIYYSEEKLQ